MKSGKRSNPLKKRYVRELKRDIGKYLVIFTLMIITIGLCSGFMIADHSMLEAYNNSFEKYNVEDGNFTTLSKLNKSQKKDIEDLGVRLCDLFSYTEKMENSTKVRMFANRGDMNQVCLMKGELPSQINEVAIDRMHADNNGYKIGDTLTTEDGKSYTITGFVALPDYSCLYEKNTDSMFEATEFGVGIVSNDMFASYNQDLLKYTYAWQYKDDVRDDIDAKAKGDDFLEVLNEIVSLDSYVPAYQNQAITFAGEDMGKDGVMIQVLCYMLILLLAFIFAITSKHTIEKEANVIGTLRASGFTRGELVGHYLTVPIIVSIISSLVGNTLGYTLFKDFCASMYYGSYSLTTYKTIWNADAFISTTIIPLIIMLVTNVVVLYTNLRKPIQKFLRGDLSRSKNKKCIPLSNKIKIFKRFKLRVIFQNMPSFILIFVGALFANLILMFGLALPSVLTDFSNKLEDNMFAKYQYMLTMPTPESYDTKLEEMMAMMDFLEEVKTDNSDAEKFSAYVLQTKEEEAPLVEEVTIYGVKRNSRYVSINHSEDGVYISSAFADKYNLGEGDKVTLSEKYEDKDYTINIVGVYEYDGAIAMFGDIDWVNDYFDLEEGTFAGYFSDSEIDDIDEKYIGAVIDYDALNKIATQLKVSMGGMMIMVDVFAVIIFVVVVYLLSKIIIEKNAHSISVTRILGYNNGEIGSLYISSISIAVIACFLISIPVDYLALVRVYKVMISAMMPGWLPINVGADVFVKMIGMCIGAYAVIAVLEYRKVKKIPMDIALKTIE